MLLERAELLIREGMEDSFATAMRERGLPLLTAVPGVKSAKMGRGVESPGKFMLLVHWDAMEAHAAFSNSPMVKTFRELIGPFSRGGAMEHFEME